MTDLRDTLTSGLAGRYSIERELGRGGMAVVFLAQDEKHQRLVALKVMLPEALGADGVARFRREIQIAARLNHPNILTVFDSGNVGDLVYYAMPYVQGETLRDAIIRERHMHIDETAMIIRQIAYALDYAHTEGVIHRDIKPANIMLARSRTGTGAGQRTPIVADFGIARAMTADTGAGLTRTGSMIGTPSYMSPEQWGSDAQLDGRADQYSLACVLYEMLIGEPPFNGSSPMVVLARASHDPVPSLRIIRPTIPEALEQVVFRAMSKVPVDRFDTMAEFADAVAAATAGPLRYSSYEDSSGSAALVDIKELRAGPNTPPRGPPTPERPEPQTRASQSFARSLPSQHGPTGSQDDTVPPTDSSVRGRRKRFQLIGVASALLLLVASALVWQLTKPAAPIRTKLLVYPFDNTGPVRDSTFADGLTAEVISRLSGVPRLAVVARTTAMQYKGTAKSLKQIGIELGVTKIVQGTVKWRPGTADARQATITVSIVDVADEVETPVKDFDAANLDDLYGIASAVAAKLDLSVDPERQARLVERPTKVREAYEAFQRGNYFYNLSWDSSHVIAAINNYETATRLDPQFALAHAALGRAHGWMYQLMHDRTEPRLAYAKAAIDSALSLSPDLPEGQLALGLYYYWGKRDYERALELFRQVQQSLPSSAETFNFIANIQRRRGALREAVRFYALSSELNPRDHAPLFNSAEALLFLREYAEAERLVDRVTEVNPAFFDGRVLKATIQIHRRGEATRARQLLADLSASTPPARWRTISHHWRAGLFRIVDESLANAERRVVAGSFGLDTAEYLLARGAMHRRFEQPAVARIYYDSALTYMLKTLQRKPDIPSVYGELSLAYAGLQRRDDAVRAAEQAVRLLEVKGDALDGPEWVVNVAIVHAMLGDPDKALSWLDRAMRIPSRLSPAWLALDPVWDPIRADARFQRLITNPPPLEQPPAR